MFDFLGATTSEKTNSLEKRFVKKEALKFYTSIDIISSVVLNWEDEFLVEKSKHMAINETSRLVAQLVDKLKEQQSFVVDGVNVKFTGNVAVKSTMSLEIADNETRNPMFLRKIVNEMLMVEIEDNDPDVKAKRWVPYSHLFNIINVREIEI